MTIFSKEERIAR